MEARVDAAVELIMQHSRMLDTRQDRMDFLEDVVARLESAIERLMDEVESEQRTSSR